MTPCVCVCVCVCETVCYHTFRNFRSLESEDILSSHFFKGIFEVSHLVLLLKREKVTAKVWDQVSEDVLCVSGGCQGSPGESEGSSGD